MNACAFTVGDFAETKEALKIASATYKLFTTSNYGEPNSVTFATFLRVCINLLPAGEPQELAVASIFKKCCSYGQVNSLVLGLLERSVSNGKITELTGCKLNNFGRIDPSSIPVEWKCNVEVESQRKSRRIR